MDVRIKITTKQAIWMLALKLTIIFAMVPSIVCGQTGAAITRYHIRMDQHFQSNRLVKSVVTMVPAQADYRAEHFSLILVDGKIQTDPGRGETVVAALVRKAIFAQLLESRGLKSISAQNQETIVTYEGIIKSPVDIAISAYDHAEEGYLYTAGARFSPLAFPDRWESLRRRYHVKKLLNDFFLLFE